MRVDRPALSEHWPYLADTGTPELTSGMWLPIGSHTQCPDAWRDSGSVGGAAATNENGVDVAHHLHVVLVHQRDARPHHTTVRLRVRHPLVEPLLAELDCVASANRGVEAKFVITETCNDSQVRRVMQQSGPDRHHEHTWGGDSSVAEHCIGNGVVEVKWLRVPTASELDHFVQLDNEGRTQCHITWLEILKVPHRCS